MDKGFRLKLVFVIFAEKHSYIFRQSKLLLFRLILNFLNTKPGRIHCVVVIKPKTKSHGN